MTAIATFLAGCGTFSVIRPADNLKAGQVELSGGVAANGLGEGVFVAQGNVGLTDWLELGGQYETYSAEGWLRFGALNTEDHGIALALSAGGGYVSLLENLRGDYLQEPAVLGGITIGRRFGMAEPYLGYRIFYLLSLDSNIQTLKLGVRISGERLFWAIEGGGTLHHNISPLGEGATVLGVKFGG